MKPHHLTGKEYYNAQQSTRITFFLSCLGIRLIQTSTGVIRLGHKAAAQAVAEKHDRQLPGELMDHINIIKETRNVKPDAVRALCLQKNRYCRTGFILIHSKGRSLFFMVTCRIHLCFKN